MFVLQIVKKHVLGFGLLLFSGGLFVKVTSLLDFDSVAPPPMKIQTQEMSSNITPGKSNGIEEGTYIGPNGGDPWFGYCHCGGIIVESIIRTFFCKKCMIEHPNITYDDVRDPYPEMIKNVENEENQ